MDSQTLQMYCIELHGKGMSVSELCTKFNIPQSTLYYWIQKHKKVSSSSEHTVTMEQYSRLLRRVEKLTQENGIFRISGCTVSAPLAQKLEEIDKLKDRFSIRSLCSVLQVRRSTFYHYSLRSPDMTQIEEEDIMYSKRIASIFKRSQERFGAKKIKVKLEEEGLQVSPRRIQRLMDEMGLVCNRSRPKRKHKKENYQFHYQNKLKQSFKQPAPNQAWVGDITYYKLGGEKIYICVVIDLYARKVLSCEVSGNMSSSLVSACFLEAYIKRNNPANLMFHSDQGTQYRSNTFQRRLKELGVIQSFSKPGCPYDNAVVESFFATLKKEELHRTTYEHIGHVRRAVEEYVVFFNTYRPHFSLNYKTPDQFENEFNA